MHLELTFLTEDETIREACKLYWARSPDGQFIHSVKGVATLTGIPTSKIPQLTKKHCRASTDDISCSECEESYVFTNRTDYVNSQNADRDWVCSPCLEAIREIEEAELFERQQAETKKKREILANVLQRRKDNNELRPEELNARECIQLLSLIRYAASEDISYIHPIASIDDNSSLTTGSYEDQNLVTDLYQKGLIVIHPDTNVNAISLKSDESFNFYPMHVSWALPVIDDHLSISNFVIQLDERIRSSDFLHLHFDEIKQLCAEIALEECLAFLSYTLADHGLNFSPGDKTKLTLSKALEHYSVAQVNNFIWGASKDAAAYFMRASVSKKQAANSVVKNIQQRFERSIANDWEVKPFRRNYDLPQSTLSRTLFNVVLMSDDGGFDKPIQKLLHSRLDDSDCPAQEPAQESESIEDHCPF
ncbi:hypothetical protein [Marinobacterium jannaschii]|uniref:hypothetical protein n=1 Tax=Marinobacterium jannaschii TaxID=64970 RepID=UPI0004884838|nr:hypothetical protein [Marinobacterium jannaschii]